MKKINIQMIAIGVVLALAVAAPVAAIDRVDTTSETTQSGDRTTNREELNKRREAIKLRVEQRITSLQDRRDVLKANVQERKATIKKDVCMKRQAILEKRIAQLSKNGSTLTSRIDAVYDKVTQFYEKGQLTVDNYDEYVETIETAKANAETSLELVSSQAFAFDCENSKLGEQLDGFRLSIAEARKSIKEYRKPVVDLIAAMRATASGEESGNE